MNQARNSSDSDFIRYMTECIEDYQKRMDSPFSTDQLIASLDRLKQNFRNESHSKNNSQKKADFNIEQSEMNVVVTAIDKINCVWVRAMEMGGLLQQIHTKINSNFERYQKINSNKIQKDDRLYIAREKDSWYRCKIIKTSPLIVLFVDYGSVTEVDELRELCEELEEVPPLATRITFKEPKFKIGLKQQLVIKPVFRNFDDTLFVKLREKTEGFFKMPDFFTTVRQDQKVAICGLKNNVIYLENQECLDLKSEISSIIAEVWESCEDLKSVEKNQQVLFENKGVNKFARGCVQEIDGKKVQISFLDSFNEKIWLNISNLKNITEDLSQIRLCYFCGGRLHEFEKTGFNKNQVALIENCIKEQKRFLVDIGFDDEFNLYVGRTPLTDQLKALPNAVASGPFFRNDLTYLVPDIGKKTYMLTVFKNKNDIWLVHSNEVKEKYDKIVIKQICDRIYKPIIGEVCLCLIVDSLYRCVVEEVLPTYYKVRQIDFGERLSVEKKNVRKIDAKMMECPAMAIRAVLTELPEIKNVDFFLEKFIVEREIYNVDVKRIKDNVCDIVIPSVYKELQNGFYIESSDDSHKTSTL